MILSALTDFICGLGFLAMGVACRLGAPVSIVLPCGLVLFVVLGINNHWLLPPAGEKRLVTLWHRYVTCRKRCSPRGIPVQRKEILMSRMLMPSRWALIFRTDSDCRGICPKCERLSVWHLIEVEVRMQQNPFNRGIKRTEEYNESEGEEWKKGQ